MLCIGYAQILNLGQSGGGSHNGSCACGNPHPGLHFRTMLRIAVVRPTLPTRGRDRITSPLKSQTPQEAGFNFVKCNRTAAISEFNPIATEFCIAAECRAVPTAELTGSWIIPSAIASDVQLLS
jgi:hypothetical protein